MGAQIKQIALLVLFCAAFVAVALFLQAHPLAALIAALAPAVVTIVAVISAMIASGDNY